MVNKIGISFIVKIAHGKSENGATQQGIKVSSATYQTMRGVRRVAIFKTIR